MKKRVKIVEKDKYKYKDPGLIEDFFNEPTDRRFLSLIKSFQSETVLGTEFGGMQLPEEQILDDDDVQIIDTLEKISGIEIYFKGGLEMFTEMVDFLDMKDYCKEACEKQIEFTPEHEEEIRHDLAYIEELMDKYHANRMAYLAEHPEQA